MIVKRLGKKLLKITGISLGVLAVLLVAFHFWFINHAKGLLEDTVSKKSNGKIRLRIKKLHYNYFTEKMVLINAEFYTTDTLTAPSSYRFDIPELHLKLNGLLTLLVSKKLLIDSLYLQSPNIQVTTLRYSKDTIKKKKEDISIPYEMGKVYKSIQDALRVLKVNQFRIENGKFTLVNKVQPGQLPLIIGDIHFQIDNLQVDPGTLSGKEKLLFSDNVVLRSNNQNILFPDGRHRLSFSRFRINLQRKLVEFDSCTIAATKKDSAGSSFTVFFNKLLLTNIDFDTLYRAEVIKADSVYCVNPKFTLDVDLDKNKGAKKNPPKLERIVEQLTGDLQLGYVVVENADFDIRTSRNGKPSSFIFSKNSFEMQGLSVNQEAAKPITVKSFAMAIRNYENFIKDSSYSMKFDSVIFKDDRITLSNFLFNKLDNGRIINTFSVPRFSLEGLSWDYLVFEKRLKARLATMYQPHISYTAPGTRNKKQSEQNLFQSLGAVNDYMDLEQLDITEGNIDLKLKDDLLVQLENATLSVKSHSLLTSTKMSGIKNSLMSLDFSTGRIRAGNLLITLDGIRYAGERGKFGARLVTVTDKEKNMAATLKDVDIEKLLVDEVKGNVTAEGIKWLEGDIKMNIAGKGSKKKSGAFIDLKRIGGFNTSIHSMVGGRSISTDLQHIAADVFTLQPGGKPVLTGFAADGKQLVVKDLEMELSIAGFTIADTKNSQFSQVRYRASTNKMVANITIPSLSVIPDIQPVLDGNIKLDALSMNRPVITLHLANTVAAASAKNKDMPVLNIGGIKMIQPEINFTRQSDSGTLSLQWHGAQNSANYLQAAGVHTSNEDGPTISLNDLQFYLTNFILTNPKGRSFNTGEGKIAAEIKDIRFSPKEDDNPEWDANITSFSAKDFRLDSLGKTGGSFVMNSAALKNLSLSSSTIIKLQDLAAANPSFQLRDFTGHYYTVATRLQWYNAGFNRSNNMFTLDSFSYRPAMEIDSFLATKKFQTDYLKAGTGALQIGPVNIDKFIRDTILQIRTAKIDKAYLFDHKDKNLPFNGGLIKPLPVNLLHKIPVRLDVDSVQLTNASVVYTEVSDKTKVAGTIPVMRMTVTLLNVKNHNPGIKDSLRIKATGYLLDTVWVRLQVNESYTDSLDGFLMTLRMKAGDLIVLNSSLIPLASVKLLSGDLDTIDMRAVGREYLSLGEMKMYYRNLKVQLLKGGKDVKQPFFTRFKSFIANAFIIRSHNNSHIGNVFFIRQRDRSAINYLIKIAFSGMASSVGVKNNKKMIRKYKRELEIRNLPPIDLD
ncbi:MAG: hypothetical protein ABL876_07300 [Chitinophagaceae bacterium]